MSTLTVFIEPHQGCDNSYFSYLLSSLNSEHPSEAVRAEIWEYMITYALFWANYADATGGFVRFDKLHTEYPELGILAEYSRMTERC